MRGLATTLVTAMLMSSAFGGEHLSLHARDAKGEPFTLASQRGKVVALTFASKSTKDQLARVDQALAKRSGRDFAVVSVIDFEDVPGIAKGIARKKVAENDRRGGVKLIVDPDGGLARSLNVDPKSHVDILVIDKRGTVRGRYDGARELADAEKKIAQLRRHRASK
jgi:peroxiredoxin